MKTIKTAQKMKKESVFSKEGADIIRAFEEIDPKNKRNYSNKTQRGSCDFLIQEYGIRNVLKTIELIKHKRGTPFFPSITSPYELEQKWTKIGEAMMRIQGNIHPNI